MYGKGTARKFNKERLKDHFVLHFSKNKNNVE